MEHEFNTLIILAEVTTAFVAFAAIVASLNATVGKQLSPYQKLLVHFFTESGMIAVSVALLPLVLWSFRPDDAVVARYTMTYQLVVTGSYLVWYVRQRLRIHAPTPLPSLLVMIGYAAWVPIWLVTLSGAFWSPSLAIISASVLWSLCSGVVIFVYFLSSFVDVDDDTY